MNMRTGRPTIYTEELGKEICDAIASSSKGIRKLCNENDSFPNPDTIYCWVKEHEDFSEQYARAKRLQIEVLADEIIEIADDTSNDTTVNANGKVIINHEHINRSRLRIDTRKWLASKLAPKIYGQPSQQNDPHDNTAQQEVLRTIREIDAVYKKDY
jgi:hypothetical protein